MKGLDEKPQLVIVRKDEREIVERDKSTKNTTVYESLAHKRPNRSMDPFLLKIPAGVAREKPLSHEGEEFLTVIHGTIEFEIDDERHVVRAGDSLYFDSQIPHRIINSYKREATVLCVFSDQSAQNSSG